MKPPPWWYRVLDTMAVVALVALTAALVSMLAAVSVWAWQAVLR